MHHRARIRRPRFLVRPMWRRRGPPGSRMWLSVLLAAVMLTLFLLWINQQIRPILRAMATTQISNAVVAAVSDAIAAGIASEHISYEDMVSVETDASGRITALKSNLAQANLLRSELLSMVLEQVSDLTTEDFSIPFGNLTDLDFLSGRGPSITVRVLSVGAANASFEHIFTEAGVNQTLHQIMLDLEVTVQILLPGETLETQVPTQVCIAETVIVGEVPNTYLQLENGGT